MASLFRPFALAQRLAVLGRRSLHISAPFNALDETARARISECVNSAPVVVFMKGSQLEPKCGFSRNVKLVLDLHHVPFRDFDVLEDEALRHDVKEFSDWPTIPQVYVNGKFVGGSDIVVQMHKDGEIDKFFDEEGIPSRFSQKFKQPTAEGGEEEQPEKNNK
ncbi:hypothetical protein niasHS_000979 [Heterodera schachtii]|uniref:Glutaredoxin-related protein 5, mitochondrial n=1 Tax=Heterodera schachtii TaxID=97005 RepID=A0ABD2K7Z8_HETSC